MKLILTSEFHRVADKLVTQSYLDTNKKVAFIQNATDARQDTGEVIHRVEAAKDRYRDHEFTLDIIDLRQIQWEKLKNTLKQYDYLHIHGWDNKHLNTISKQSWLFDMIHTLLDDGLIYIGSSAWSLLTWPDTTYAIITNLHYKTEISQEEVEAMDFSWFWLHPFYLIPHASKADRLEMMTGRLRYCESHKLSPFLTYADNQAIIIENWHIIFIS